MNDQNTNNNENTTTTEQAATNTAPYLKNKTEDTSTTHEPHKYFIPGIIILVLSVIVVETFYEREPTNLVAELTSSDTAEQQATSGNTEAAAAITAEIDTTKITQASNTTDITETIEPETKTVAQLNTADSNSEITVTNTTSITANDKPAQGEKPGLAASQAPATHSAPRAHPAYPPPPFEPPMPYGMSPQQQQRYVDMMERRRNAYAQAMESYRQHMEQMHQYRMTVLKRIEQDRREMDQRMEELRVQSERAHVDAMQRMEEARKHSVRRPI